MLKPSKQTQQFLLELARRAIKFYLEKKVLLEVQLDDIPENIVREVQAKAGIFVTLNYKEPKVLRGCIGEIESGQEAVYLSVIKHAVNAAFFDPRFKPVQKEELSNISIEISILSKPKPFKMEKDKFIHFLAYEKPGVILEQGYRKATFLPQVWEEVNSVEEFLEHLSLKAGLPKDGYKDKKTRFKVYRVLKFSE